MLATNNDTIVTGSNANAASSVNNSSYIKAYEEICKSYHAIDDFRVKLLGLLPLTSLIGIFALTDKSLFGQGIGDLSKQIPVSTLQNHLIAFIGMFAAVFTLALFIFEIRGIIRCNNLIEKGKKLESLLGVEGQFYVCSQEHQCSKKESDNWKELLISLFDAKLAACIIYSVVFAAWIFTALKFGFNWSIWGCAVTALLVGVISGVGTFYLVRKLIAA